MTSDKDQSITRAETSLTVGAVESSVIKHADFEKAIAASGYGKFNYLLLLSIIPVSWATSIDTANMSMILTPAECDLQLTMLHKGILNAITYAGMVSSSMMWGFLADIFGRRNILVYGFMVDGFCNILSGLSQTTWVLVGFKFLSGFIVSGAFASIISYSAEFHATKDRPKVLLRVALASSFGNIVNGVFALSIIPRDWSLVIRNRSSNVIFTYNSWRIFLSCCGLPTLFGAICLTFFPESPKFLMSQGRNEEAMKVFRKIYSINTGQPKENYPIQSLEKETLEHLPKDVLTKPLKKKNNSFKISIFHGIKQMRPLLSKEYLKRLLMVIFAQFGAYMATNTIRLWQPHVFAVLETYETNSSDTTTFCNILDSSMAAIGNETSIGTQFLCSGTKPEFVYTNNLIIALTTIVVIFVAGIIVIYIDHKKVLMVSSALPLIFLVAMNWSTSTIITLVFVCLFVALMSTTANLVVAMTVNLFPTSLRTMAVSLVMMFGRIGAVTGSILFPVLLERGCFLSIIALAAFVFMCFVLIIFMPKPEENVK